MKKRFLNYPNLPENKVTTVFAQIDDNRLESFFNELSIKVVPIIKNEFLDHPINQHADILCNNVGKSNFLVDKHQIELCTFIEDNNGKYVIIDNIKSPYPSDCLLNFADIGNYIICNKSILTDEIVDLGAESGVLEKSGAWYSYNGEKIGQGKENVKMYLRENINILMEIEDKVRECYDISDKKEKKSKDKKSKKVESKEEKK